MRITIVEKDTPENSSGGCNLVILDFLICIIFVTYYLHSKADFELITSIFFGFLSGVLFFFLLNIPYIGFILQITLGVLWGLIIFQIFLLFSLCGSDSVFGHIISIAFGILLHIASFYELGGEIHFPLPSLPSKRTKKKNNKGQNQTSNYDYIFFSDAYNKIRTLDERLCHDAENLLNEYSRNDLDIFYREYSTYKTRFVALQKSFAQTLLMLRQIQDPSYVNQARDIMNELDDLQRQLNTNIQITRQIQINRQKEEANNKKEHDSYSSKNQQTDENINHQSTNNTYESLFNGCNDLSSLTKRYKDLMKTFHPDNQNGDHEMTVKITNTYQYLKKKYE